MTIPILKSPHEMLLELAGIPHLASGGSPPSIPKAKATLKAINPKILLQAMADKPPPDLPADVFMPRYHGPPEFYFHQDKQPIEYWRRGTVPKNTTKEGLETTASKQDANEMRNWISVMRAGEKYGVPQLPPSHWAGTLFKEGRPDFGYNEFDYRNPKSLEIYRNIVKEGYDPIAAGFASAVYDAHRKAKLKGGDPSGYWFGEGISADKQTSPQYMAGMKANMQYVNHPQNAPLLNMLQNAYDNPVPPPPIPVIDKNLPQEPAQMPNVDIMSNPTGYANGGTIKPFRDISKMLIQKHISGK
jgi:hypothetical protein